MDRYRGRDILRRSRSNPIIPLQTLPFRASDILNAGLVKYQDRYLMLVTVEMLEGSCGIFRARSEDGENFTVDPEPFMTSIEEGPNREHETMGVRDVRITPMDDVYYITYVADGKHGLRVGLAKTEDFRSVERLGFATQVDVKNGALFPRKIGGTYVLIERPDAGMSIWVTYSDDLVYWGGAAAIMTPRGGYWDPTRIGAAAPPIEIDEGWLLIYYGQKHTSAGPLVRLGAAILDRDDPATVLARSNIPILSPREKYERIGDVPNVVFSCGALLEGEDVVVCYGASDSCICMARASLKDIVQTCSESEREF